MTERPHDGGAPATAERSHVGGIGLKARVYLLMATGFFFPLALMAATGWYWLHQLDERLLEGRLANAATVAAHFDEEATGDLEILQRLASGVSEPVAAGDAAATGAALREANRTFRHRESVFILDARKRVLAEEPPGTVSAAPPPDLAVVDEVLRTGLPRMSGIVFGPRGAVVYQLVPIRRWDSQVIGIAGGTLLPDRREFGKMLQHLRRGETGFAELVDSDGRVVASTVRGRVGRVAECHAHLGELIHDRRSETAECAACHAESEVRVKTRPDLLTFAPLATASWGVVVRQAVDEALPTQGAVPWRTILGVLAVQLALASAFAWGAARSVTQPVAVLTSEAERIAGGELAWPIPDLGEDEVGRLGKSLDRMRENLKGLVDHIARANEQLEARVRERTHALDEANAQLREREAARGELLRKVIAAQEDERKRIARELHDETSQSLAVLAIGLEAAQDAMRNGRLPHLDEVKAVAVRTLEDVHRLILDLRPSVLDDLGLLSAIRWYADRTLEARGIAVRCEFAELRRLPPEMETALFRICQEAMSNVARHAQATRVLIQVGIEGERVRVEIEDDGKGFDLEAAAQREGRRPWGLMGIRERAEIFGGTATIDAAPGQGTRVEVILPLPPDEGR